MSDSKAFPIEELKNPYVTAAAKTATGAWAQKRRLATAMRRVIDLLMSTKAPEQDLATFTDGLEAFAEGLEAHPRSKVLWGFAETANAGDVHAFFDQSPMVGHSNPLAPPLELEVVDGRILGRARFGLAYQGPPGTVHGGYVAAAMDELLGLAQSLSGAPGMTAKLEVRYRRPTPLSTELVLEAGLDKVEGRKIFASGTIRDETGITAEAKGLFVTVDPNRFAEMVAAAEARKE